MRVGIPREVKDGESRVALSPEGVKRLSSHVVVEPDAGTAVGFQDRDYVAAGAQLGDPWQCELVVKVKELQPQEYGRPRPGQTIFGFQHFGPDPGLLDAALASGATFVAYETVGQDDASLPILAPMSAIAGRLALQVGGWCLQKPNGGSGVLLSGVEGVEPGHVAILGAGNVGSNALAIAHGIGARVTVYAKSDRRFAALRARYPRTRFSTLIEGLDDADLIVGGVLTPGRMSPKVVTRATLRRMRPGSALVDVGIDQGGIAETSRPTSHSDPIYKEEGIVHYCVPNMPAACARTASLALEYAVLPYVRMLAAGTFDAALGSGVQVRAGRITHEFLARDTGRAWSPA
ncbi:MAG: alanine dehydrogenase [Burkholderiales bacterium]